ncbi:MAG: DUF1801 domain-containing protein [Candidatus Pacebacteria bacterium]|nr:DUF1801 domain-containing protein [Candidatus Paceibacterota bacterium]
MNKKIYKTIDAYIKDFPKDKQVILQKVREVISKSAPKAIESIKYGMPTFELNGNLVHFAAMKGHLGFYPAPSAIKNFQKDLLSFSTSKGCIRFKYEKPIPYSLIEKIVKFRVKENK